MIQAAWRLAIGSPRSRQMLVRLQINTGSKKKAIVGVARHLLCMMFAMLQSSRPYELLGVPNGNHRSTKTQEAAETSARARQKGARGNLLGKNPGEHIRSDQAWDPAATPF